MSLYLIHEPLIFYLETAINGIYEREHDDNFEELFRRLPFWSIPIHIIASLIMATAITLLFEEPMRKKLKEWRENNKKKQQSAHNGGRGINQLITQYIFSKLVRHTNICISFD